MDKSINARTKEIGGGAEADGGSVRQAFSSRTSRRKAVRTTTAATPTTWS